MTRAVRWVPPSRCRIWTGHNRRYDLLDHDSCADLLEGFRQRKQELPATVRRVTDDADYDYEVICGARRHWTAAELKRDLLVEVRELTDIEAFSLADIENRHRKDISDYERAVDYVKALDLYYGGSQKTMALNLECTESWLSRYLQLGRLEQDVVAAMRDVREITERGARDVLLSLKGKSRDTVLARARELASEEPKSSAQEVFRQLALVVKPPRKRGDGVLERIAAKVTGKPLAVVSRRGKAGLAIDLEPKSGADLEEVVAALRAVLERHYVA